MDSLKTLKSLLKYVLLLSVTTAILLGSAFGQEPSKPVDPVTPPGPVEPVDPVVPIQPDDPEEPEEPDTPDIPDVPDEPEEPDTPSEPDIPDAPDEPYNPDTPDAPDIPDAPDEPQEPDTPSEPDVPDTPDEPQEPDTPSEPNVPDTPDEPEIKDSDIKLEQLCEQLFTNSAEYNPFIADFSIEMLVDYNDYKICTLDDQFELIDSRTEYDNEFIDSPNTIPYRLYCKTIVKDTDEFNLYILKLDGTGAEKEWVSNVSIGQYGNRYHEGFEKAAEYVIKNIKNIISKDIDHNKILLGGYSRGAAVGAILAAKLCDANDMFEDENIFAYTYACPNYSISDAHYNNLFCICNIGDAVTKLPMSAWDYGKEGNVIYLSTDCAVMKELNATLQSKHDFIKEYYVENYFDNDFSTYIGFTKDINFEVNKLAKAFSPYNVHDDGTVNALANLAMVIARGNELDINDFSTLFSTIKQSGDIWSLVDVAMFAISGKDKIIMSHVAETYWAWTLAMNKIKY